MIRILLVDDVQILRAGLKAVSAEDSELTVVGEAAMRIVEINSLDYGSTGNICMQLADAARLRGHEAFIATPWRADTRTEASVSEYALILSLFTVNPLLGSAN